MHEVGPRPRCVELYLSDENERVEVEEERKENVKRTMKTCVESIFIDKENVL